MAEKAEKERKRTAAEAAEAAGADVPEEDSKEAPTANTTIKANGVEYDLKEIKSPEQVKALFDALPEEYQARAKEIEKVAARFDAVVVSNNPNLDIGGIIKGINDGSNAIALEVVSKVAAMVTNTKEKPREAGDVLGHAGDFFGSALGAALHTTTNAPTQIWGIGDEVAGAVGRNAAQQAEIDLRAKRYGVIYAAAMYAEVQTANRTDLPTFGLPFGEKDLFWSYPDKGFDALFKWLTYGKGSPVSFILKPVATFMNGFGAGIGKFFEVIFEKETFFNFSAAFEAAKAAFTEGQQKSQRDMEASSGRSFRDILIENITNGERKSAAQMVNAAEAFGDKTEEITDLIANGGFMRTRNPNDPLEGRIEAVQFTNGKIQAVVVPGSSTTTAERLEEHANAILPRALRNAEGKLDLSDKGDGAKEAGAITGSIVATGLVVGTGVHIVKRTSPMIGRQAGRVAAAVMIEVGKMPSAFLRGYAEGRGGKFFLGDNEHRTKAPRVAAVRNHPKVDAALHKVNKLELQQARHYARAARLQHSIAILEAAKTVEGADAKKLSGAIAKLTTLTQTQLKHAANFDKVSWWDLPRRELDPRKWQWNKWLPPKPDSGHLTRAQDALQGLLNDTKARATYGRQYIQVMDMNTRRTVVAEIRDVNGSMLSEARLLTQGRIPAAAMAESIPMALTRVQALQTQVSLTRDLTSRLKAAGAGFEDLAKAQQIVADAAQALAKEATRLSRLPSSLANAADVANLTNRAAEVARLQSEAVSLIDDAARAATSADDAAKAAQLARFRDAAFMAAETAKNAARAAENIVITAGGTITDWSTVIAETPEALRVMTPEVAAGLEKGALTKLDATSIRHISAESFGKLSKEAIAALPDAALAGATRGQIQAYIKEASGLDDATARAERLKALFTPERVAAMKTSLRGLVPAELLKEAEAAIKAAEILDKPAAGLVGDKFARRAADAEAALSTANKLDGAIDEGLAGFRKEVAESDQKGKLRKSGLKGAEARKTMEAHGSGPAVKEAEAIMHAAEDAAKAGAEGGGLLRGAAKMIGGAAGVVSKFPVIREVGTVCRVVGKIPGLKYVVLPAGALLALGAVSELSGAVAHAETLIGKPPEEGGISQEEFNRIKAHCEFAKTAEGVDLLSPIPAMMVATEKSYYDLPECLRELVPAPAITSTVQLGRDIGKGAVNLTTGRSDEEQPQTDGALGNADAALSQQAAREAAARAQCQAFAAALGFSRCEKTDIGATYAGYVPDSAAPNLIPTVNTTRPVTTETYVA